jgi:hypothetical protein
MAFFIRCAIERQKIPKEMICACNFLFEPSFLENPEFEKVSV